jgi:hypothetical protein
MVWEWSNLQAITQNFAFELYQKISWFPKLPYICKNKSNMENKKKSTALFWILFFVSIAAFFGVYEIGGGYCSMVLPFNVTFFAMAMDLM